MCAGSPLARVQIWVKFRYLKTSPGVRSCQAKSIRRNAKRWLLCCQVLGNDVALSIGGASGNVELNEYKPIIIHNFLQSVHLLACGIASFDKHCVRGITPNTALVESLLASSLMVVTALVRHIDYDRAADIAKLAHLKSTSLREAALLCGTVSEADFDEWTQPRQVIKPTD